ncbi:MAG: UDP-N-acetylmuramate:L-alanyl-gamma-D-glutamyl-meso-diaminopimelate ligase, partial [Panacagrimonas sp.]
FMGGLAVIAKADGHQVTGCDANVYPPMSTQLEALGITVMRGYDPAHLDPAPDVVVVGNVVTRGAKFPAMEHVLDVGLPYVSGPQWLAENVLPGRHVLAVAGTHGKTTTTSLLAWLLDQAGLEPGFLVGGVPMDFGVSARLGRGRHFVIEADEYDTAFFDKRSKFVHYRPRTCILNNLEYDHADIFPDLAAIERQFHHLVRTVPASGKLIVNGADANLERVLAMGAWTSVERFDHAEGWSAVDGMTPDAFELRLGGVSRGEVRTPLAGRHNRSNTLAAFAAAAAVGVPVERCVDTLSGFRGVRRRLEKLGEVGGITVYDDFAHHPTAIEVTLDALRRQPGGRILAVLEPRSNTMRLGSHADQLAQALAGADRSFVLVRPDLGWDVASALGSLGERLVVASEVDALVEAIVRDARSGDRVLVMSNGDFGGIHGRILAALAVT